MNNQNSNWRRQCQREPPVVIRDLGRDHHVTLAVIHDQDLDLGLHIKVEEAEVDMAEELVHHGVDEANTGMFSYTTSYFFYKVICKLYLRSILGDPIVVI